MATENSGWPSPGAASELANQPKASFASPLKLVDNQSISSKRRLAPPAKQTGSGMSIHVPHRRDEHYGSSQNVTKPLLPEPFTEACCELAASVVLKSGKWSLKLSYSVVPRLESVAVASPILVDIDHMGFPNPECSSVRRFPKLQSSLVWTSLVGTPVLLLPALSSQYCLNLYFFFRLPFYYYNAST